MLVLPKLKTDEVGVLDKFMVNQVNLDPSSKHILFSTLHHSTPFPNAVK
jgi:hypothetical protein